MRRRTTDITSDQRIPLTISNKRLRTNDNNIMRTGTEDIMRTGTDSEVSVFDLNWENYPVKNLTESQANELNNFTKPAGFDFFELISSADQGLDYDDDTTPDDYFDKDQIYYTTREEPIIDFLQLSVYGIKDMSVKEKRVEALKNIQNYIMGLPSNNPNKTKNVLKRLFHSINNYNRAIGDFIKYKKNGGSRKTRRKHYRNKSRRHISRRNKSRRHKSRRY